MGICFGYFRRSGKKGRLYKLERTLYIRDQEAVEDEACGSEHKPPTLGQRMVSFFCLRHSRSGQTEHLIESETDNSWMDMKDDYENVVTSDIALQSSDVLLVPLEVRTVSARTLVPTWRTVSFSSSTPPSSVDLEWENEGIVESNNSNIPLVVHRRLTSTTEEGSIGSVSVVECSPAESLEWDPCETTLDNDTEQLLCEIERLTARALRETGGDWTNR